MTNWKKTLTHEQYRILREKGTEEPFSGKYFHHTKTGMYVCAGCRAELFSSDAKIKPGTEPAGLHGWPSFDDAKNVDFIEDSSHGMQRIEVVCHNCGGHLGHVFDDPQEKTGKHYCINSLSLGFTPSTE